MQPAPPVVDLPVAGSWLWKRRTLLSRSSSPLTSCPVFANARILAIDDHPSVLVALEYVLPTFGGYTVVSASNGTVGLEIASKGGIDLILMDVDMPSFGGIAVLEKLQANPDLKHVPVVMMSGRATPSVVATAMAAGARAVVSKPFDLPALQATLAQHLPPGPSGATL
jgi:CheY-like chemotaxis protein